jgi:hypothetical protein
MKIKLQFEVSGVGLLFDSYPVPFKEITDNWERVQELLRDPGLSNPKLVIRNDREVLFSEEWHDADKAILELIKKLQAEKEYRDKLNKALKGNK